MLNLYWHPLWRTAEKWDLILGLEILPRNLMPSSTLIYWRVVRDDFWARNYWAKFLVVIHSELEPSCESWIWNLKFQGGNLMPCIHSKGMPSWDMNPHEFINFLSIKRIFIYQIFQMMIFSINIHGSWGSEGFIVGFCLEWARFFAIWFSSSV